MATTWAEYRDEYRKNKSYPTLGKDLDVDIVIIGGGLTGVMTAHMLSGLGKKVALLEARYLGCDATIHTTAFITHFIDTHITDLVDMFGKDQAKLVWESGIKATNTLEEIIIKENIDCEFVRCPAYIYALTEKQQEVLKEEEKIARQLGFDITFKNDDRLGFNNHGYLEISNQSKFHPLKFLYKLAEIAQKNGVMIFEDTEAAGITDKEVSVKTKNGHTITAEKVIIATYDPFNKPKATFAKKGMYNSYVLEVELPKGKFGEALYWDQNNPYYYFRIDPKDKYDRMIIGGADHRSELRVSKEKSFADLEEHVRKILGVSDCKINKKWAGPILESSDGIPLIGEYEPNRYLATAFSGNGMTYAAVASLIFKDLISGQKNDWVDFYDPNRRRKFGRYLKKVIDYSQEFVGGAVKNTFGR